MADLILNEWLWEDLRGANGPDRRKESVRVLLAVLERSDRLVVVLGSPFVQKWWRLCRDARDAIEREAVTVFRNIFVDSQKCLQLENLGPAPADLENACKQDDHYLIRALVAVPGSVMVTTDGGLRAAVGGFGLLCRDRDDWLLEYLSYSRAANQGMPRTP